MKTNPGRFFEDYALGEVIRHALVRVPEPIEWDGTVETPAIGVVDGTDETGATVAH